MFDQIDCNNIWVSPESSDGNGTWEKPFDTIERALGKVEPGNSIILKEGIYKNDLTIQVSGTARAPIRILPDENASVEIHNACWFLYDTSDIIISGLIFKDSPYGAISVIGECRRNRFDSLKFINCGTPGKTSCTLYFGGSGGEFNVVENCVFQHAKVNVNGSLSTDNISIGLMVSEGDLLDDAKPLKNHVFRRNHLVNYTHGILVGSSDSTVNLYGHIVEYNTVENCDADGILVKCGDTQIRGNLIQSCRGKSISVLAGTDSVVENNRIIECGSGIDVRGAGHSVSNNCIVRCGEHAVKVCGKSNNLNREATNLFIVNNTFIDCGSISKTPGVAGVAGITIEPGTSCIIQRNLISGQGKPYELTASIHYSDEEIEYEINTPASYVVQDNAVSGQCEIMDGVSVMETGFQSPESGNFENQSGYGASGWMMRPEAFDPHIDETEECDGYVEASVLEDEEGELIIPGEIDKQDLFSRFFSESVDNEMFVNDDE